MKKWFLLLTIVTYATTASAATTGRGGVFFGTKSLDHGDWGDLDNQGMWGINLDVKDTSWPVWATAAYISSRDEDTIVTSVAPFATRSIEGKTSEIRVGVKKDFIPARRVLFSVAGGPASIRASLDRPVAPFDRDTDSSLGFWAGADVFVFLGFIVVGASYQYSKADVDLLGQSVDAGGKNLAFTLGFGW